MRVIGYWFAVCPECGAELKPSLPRWKTTRKNAKDELHKHMQRHAGPGGSST